MKSIPAPMRLEEKYFAQARKAAIKYVESAFGVLQAQFSMVRGTARVWYKETLTNIMKACIAMHNIIIENESDSGSIGIDNATPSVTLSREQIPH